MISPTVDNQPIATLKLPPGPPPATNIIETLRAMSAFSADSMGTLQKLRARYGNMMCLKFGSHLQYIFADPDAVRDVTVTQAAKFHKDASYKDAKRGLARFMGNGLVTSDGEFWRRQRRMVAPALHAKRVMSYGEATVAHTRDLLNGWRDGVALDLGLEMNRLTLNIIAETLFHANVSGEFKQVVSALNTMQRVAGEPSRIPLPAWLPLPKDFESSRATRTLDTIIYRIINERRASNEDKGDLLSMLLLAEDDDGKRMTDREARDEAVTLFLAGQETTANALKWTWILLAQNPDVEAKLHHELDTVLAGQPPTVADLERLPYTDQVIKELMRVYPPVPGFGRRAIADVEVGGYTIPKNAEVLIMTYLMHHDPQTFPDPERFDPERFSAANEAAIPKYAYIPFGSGPRICIGNAFAMMESRLILATIASRYAISLKTGYKPEMLPLVTLNPKGALPVTLHARKAI